MRIVFDNIIYSLQNIGGISHYWYWLTDTLLKENVELKFVEHADENNFFRNKLNIPFSNKLKKTKGNKTIERFKAVTLPLEDGDVDIFHSSYYRVLKNKKGAKEIITLHDFIEFQNKSRLRVFHRRQLHKAITHADGIICISEKTKKELFDFYPNLKTKNVEVIHHGVDPYYKILTEDEISVCRNWSSLIEERGKLVLYVGDRDAKYKRFQDLVLALKETEYKLIIAGGGVLSNKLVAFLEEHLANRYISNPFVDFDVLNFFYNISNCLIYPSVNEGFGAPLLETAKAGCPYIVFKNRIPEVLKYEWGVELEELNTKTLNYSIESCKAIKIKMQQEITDDDFISWNDTINKTLKFYQKVLSNT